MIAIRETLLFLLLMAPLYLPCIVWAILFSPRRYYHKWIGSGYKKIRCRRRR
ncbi:MAG: hypothetical protein IJW16_00080 [Clostridia bacterium]|nr:hypothetical protein [Clostridia bacterium]